MWVVSPPEPPWPPQPGGVLAAVPPPGLPAGGGLAQLRLHHPGPGPPPRTPPGPAGTVVRTRLA